MPFDFATGAAPATRPAMQAPELHGVPREELVRHALDQLAPGLRAGAAPVAKSKGIGALRSKPVGSPILG